MIAAVYTQGGQFQVADLPPPEPADDEVLLRVEAAGICGTDVKIVRHGHRKLRTGQRIVLGHEFVGTIEEVGPRVDGFSVGTRVGVAPNIGCGRCEMCGRGLGNMCPDYGAFGIDRDGAHTELVRIPQAAIAQGNLIPLGPAVSPLDAALAEPLSCVVSAMRSVGLSAGEVVLVYGAGPMGLLNMLLASAMGASRVLVVDRDDLRLQRAREVGASAVLNSGAQPVPEWVAEQTRGRGVDVVITAAAVPELQAEAIGLLAPFGRLNCFAGLPNGGAPVALDTNAIHYRNLSVTGTTGGSARDYRDAVRLIESRKVNVSCVVSDVFPIREVGRAYERALAGGGMKVLVAAEKFVRPRRMTVRSEDREAERAVTSSVSPGNGEVADAGRAGVS